MADGRSPEPSRRAWLFWIGSGLVLAGLVGVAVGIAYPVQPARAGFPRLAIVGVVFVVLALLAIAVLSWRRRRAGEQDDTDRQLRHWMLGTIIVAGLVAAYVWWQAFVDLAGGFVTRALPTFAVGLALIAVGLVLVAVRPRADATTSLVARVSVSLLCALGGGALAVIVGLLIEQAPLDHVVVPDADTASPAEGAPARVAWQWDTPTPDRAIARDDVVPTAAGMAVRTADGVVALDAETGETVWHYRRAGATTVSIGGTDEWVHVTMRSGVDPGSSTVEGPLYRLLVFHAETGELAYDLPSPRGVLLGFTADSLVVGWPDESWEEDAAELAAFGLDGARRWEWRVPSGCEVASSPTMDLAGGVVIVARSCADDPGDDPGDDPANGSADASGQELGILVGLDARTGERVWESTYRAVTGFEVSDVSADGAVARVSYFDPDQADVLVDAATGEELLPATDLVPVSYDADGVVQYADGLVSYTPVVDGVDGVGETAVESGCRSEGPRDERGERRLVVADALVELCLPPDSSAGGSPDAALRVGVLPWEAADEAIEVTVDRPGGDGDASRTAPALVKLPTVTLVADGTRLTALAP